MQSVTAVISDYGHMREFEAALEDMTGIRMTDLPMTTPAVLKAIQADGRASSNLIRAVYS